jgi:hypothetical protein
MVLQNYSLLLCKLQDVSLKHSTHSPQSWKTNLWLHSVGTWITPSFSSNNIHNDYSSGTGQSLVISIIFSVRALFKVNNEGIHSFPIFYTGFPFSPIIHPPLRYNRLQLPSRCDATYNRASPQVNLCQALGTTCNSLSLLIPPCWTSLVIVFHFFPFAAHLCHVPWTPSLTLHCTLCLCRGCQELCDEEGELWLLVLAGKVPFHLRLLN